MRKLKNSGYTLVEVTIALTVTGMIMLAILGFTTNMLVQYSEANVRTDLLSEAQKALDIANNDIRLSASADDTNRWPDTNAPEGDFSWESGDDTLVLATAVEDTGGDISFADESEYISHKNNIIYFVSEGSLYKRVLAAPVANNSATTTCPESGASSECPEDSLELDNVSNFNVRYFDGNNNEVEPTNARSVEITVELYEEEFSRPISVNYTTRMVFRNG